MRLGQEDCAKLIEEMITQTPWCTKAWARAALASAARAIRRGRHLNAKEQLDNLKKALADG
jgi:hypothetical protein